MSANHFEQWTHRCEGMPQGIYLECFYDKQFQAFGTSIACDETYTGPMKNAEVYYTTSWAVPDDYSPVKVPDLKIPFHHQSDCPWCLQTLVP